MLASMIGLGPHEMTAGLWVFSLAITIALVLLVPVALFAAMRATVAERRVDVVRRYPGPVSADRVDWTHSTSLDHSKESSRGGRHVRA